MSNWVSFSPHIKDKQNVNRIYTMFIIACIPMLLDGVIKYGYNAALIVAISVLTAFVADLFSSWVLYKKFKVKDCSSIYIGLLIGLSMPSGVVWFIPMIGTLASIILVKTLAGGLGKNFISEVAFAKLLLALMFGSYFYKFIDPSSGLVVSSTLSDDIMVGSITKINYKNLLFGITPGAIGETGVVYVLLGGLFLCCMGVIDYKMPLGFLSSAFLTAYLLLGLNSAIVLTCSMCFVAFFVLTDYATTPSSGLIKFVYSLLLGVVAVLIFAYGSYRYAGYYACLIGGLIYSAIKGSVLPTKQAVKK